MNKKHSANTVLAEYVTGYQIPDARSPMKESFGGGSGSHSAHAFSMEEEEEGGDSSCYWAEEFNYLPPCVSSPQLPGKTPIQIFARLKTGGIFNLRQIPRFLRRNGIHY